MMTWHLKQKERIRVRLTHKYLRMRIFGVLSFPLAHSSGLLFGVRVDTFSPFPDCLVLPTGYKYHTNTSRAIPNELLNRSRWLSARPTRKSSRSLSSSSSASSCLSSRCASTSWSLGPALKSSFAFCHALRVGQTLNSVPH